MNTKCKWREGCNGELNTSAREYQNPHEFCRSHREYADRAYDRMVDPMGFYQAKVGDPNE